MSVFFMPRSNYLIIFTLCISWILTLSQAQAQADRIVYSAYMPENWDIYYFENRGDIGRQLTHDPSLDYEPAFSPNGRWIVFTSERNGSPDLFALDLDDESAAPQLLIESDAMEDQVAFSPDGRTLYFTSSRDGNADIFSIPFLPGTIQSMGAAVNLTNHPGGDFRPSVSPDGTHIAFSSDRDTPTKAHSVFAFSRQREGELYVMNTDGGNQTRITQVKDWDGSPVWSKDGKSLFYYSAGGRPEPPELSALTQEGGFRIWSVDLENLVPRPVSPGGVEALWPALTTDGRIAFATRSSGGYAAPWKIVSVDMDGQDLQEESDTTRSYWAPEFSEQTGAMVAHGAGAPEENILPGCGFEGRILAAGFPVSKQIGELSVKLYGMRHAFAVSPHPKQSRVAIHCVDDGGGSIITADVDGSNPQTVVQLARGSEPSFRPFGIKYSKDGEWITYMVGPFWGNADEDADVRTVKADGSSAINLSSTIPENDGLPDYSRDDRTIVFRSGRSGFFDLYMMKMDESHEVIQLTNDPAKDNFPVFSPTSNLIAFASNRDGIPDETGYREFDIYTLDPGDGSAEPIIKRITNSPGQDAHVQFSPDGEWLIYSSEQGGINDEEPLVQELFFGPQMYGEIYALRLSDGYQIRLTHNKWEDGAPFWVGPPLSSDSDE